MTLWTSQDAVAATGGQSPQSWTASGVSIDTRTLQPGDLFVALQAARDGHDFVGQALEKGAAAALVSRQPDGVPGDAPLLLVDDVLEALEALGRAARARTQARVVAVTGSAGKTSTKEMLRAMLTPQGATHASVASYNNHWGVPLTLARMPKETHFAIIEIGMNHPGEIAPLSRLARPHVAMVTTVAPAHLEAFESVDGIAREKASILEGLEPGGTAVLNADIDTAPVLRDVAQRRAATTLWFGKSAADYTLRDVVLDGDITIAQAVTLVGPALFKVQSPGTHFAMNALGALACISALGADVGRAVSALGLWTPYAGRGARASIALDLTDPRATLTLIDDSYNANPASVAAGLEVLSAAKVTHDIGRVSKGRRMAVLGDMKELGETEAALHAALAEHPAMEHIDQVHCVGPLMAHLHAGLPEALRGLQTEDAAGMAAALPRRLDAGDVVLVKGSLSMGLSAVVDAIHKMGEGTAQ